MALAGCFHVRKLTLIELWAIDVSPVESGRVHREAGRHGAVGTNDDVVLSGAAVRFSEPQFAAWLLDNSGHRVEQLGLMAISIGSVPIPAVLLQIETRRHAYECLDLL